MAVADVIDNYFRCVNDEDWETFAHLWHDDAELRWVGIESHRGKAAVLAHYPEVLSRFEEHHDEVTRMIPAGDTVTVEIHFTGRTRDGRPVEFDAVDIFDLEDGRIRRLSVWYDSSLVGRMVQGPETRKHR